jgi:hypothetical protein
MRSSSDVELGKHSLPSGGLLGFRVPVFVTGCSSGGRRVYASVLTTPVTQNRLGVVSYIQERNESAGV